MIFVNKVLTNVRLQNNFNYDKYHDFLKKELDFNLFKILFIS